MPKKDLSLVVLHHTLRGHAIPLTVWGRTMTYLGPPRDRPEITPSRPRPRRRPRRHLARRPPRPLPRRPPRGHPRRSRAGRRRRGPAPVPESARAPLRPFPWPPSTSVAPQPRSPPSVSTARPVNSKDAIRRIGGSPRTRTGHPEHDDPRDQHSRPCRTSRVPRPRGTGSSLTARAHTLRAAPSLRRRRCRATLTGHGGIPPVSLRPLDGDTLRRTQGSRVVAPTYARGKVPGAGLEPARPQQGQRGLSSPCLHSTIRAGRGLRVGPPEPIGTPHPNCAVVGRCCLILLTPEGVSGHGNRHQHMPTASRAGVGRACGMTEFHRPNKGAPPVLTHPAPGGLRRPRIGRSASPRLGPGSSLPARGRLPPLRVRRHPQV